MSDSSLDKTRFALDSFDPATRKMIEEQQQDMKRFDEQRMREHANRAAAQDEQARDIQELIQTNRELTQQVRRLLEQLAKGRELK